MLRKLAIRSTIAATFVSLAFASSAAAMIPTDPANGTANTSGASVASTGGSFPWGDVTSGVVIALAVAALAATALYFGRHRRRLALDF